MANEKIKQNYKDIADAIRAKTGENGLIKAEEIPSKIESIHVGIEPEGTKEIVENAEQINVREFEFVDVAVPTGVFPEGSLDITANANNIDVTNKAAVNVNVPNPSSGTLEITENGNYDVTEKAEVNVEVPVPENTGELEWGKLYKLNSYDEYEYYYKGESELLTEETTSSAGYDGYYNCNGSQQFVGEYAPERISEGWYILHAEEYSNGGLTSFGELDVGGSAEVELENEYDYSNPYRFRIERIS